MGPIGRDDPQPDQPAGDEVLTTGAAEDEPPGPGRITFDELWPPSPRVKILYIGLAFFLFNLLLICIWAVALYISRQ